MTSSHDLWLPQRSSRLAVSAQRWASGFASSAAQDCSYFGSGSLEATLLRDLCFDACTERRPMDKIRNCQVEPGYDAEDNRTLDHRTRI